MTQRTRLPAAPNTLTSAPIPEDVPAIDADRGESGPVRPRPTDSPADGPESVPGEPGATADDLRKFGTPDVLPKPFTRAETGRKLREETRRRDEEDAVQDDRWRDDGGQGDRPPR
jgi:hypothetical protein